VWTIPAADEELLVHPVLICVRDTKWSAPVLKEAGIRVVQTPHHAPKAMPTPSGS
jgi:hypothetical protein